MITAWTCTFFFLVVRLQQDGDDVGFAQHERAELGAGVGREEWRRGKDSVGNLIGVSGFEQRSAGSALTFPAKKEINLKNSQKPKEAATYFLQRGAIGCYRVRIMQSLALPPSNSCSTRNSPCCSVADGFLMCACLAMGLCWCGHLRRGKKKNQTTPGFAKYVYVYVYIHTYIHIDVLNTYSIEKRQLLRQIFCPNSFCSPFSHQERNS